MEKIKSVDYNALIKEIEGKTIQDIVSLLQEKYDIFKEVDNISMFSKLDTTINNITELSKDVPSVYIFMKKQNIYFDAIELFTNIEMLPREGSMNDYSIELESALRLLNINFNMYYVLVEEGLTIKQQAVLNELVDAFDTKLPTVEEIQAMKTELDNMFSNESEDKLKIIDDILAFNDPTLVGIKDALTQAGIDNAREKIVDSIKEDKK